MSKSIFMSSGNNGLWIKLKTLQVFAATATACFKLWWRCLTRSITDTDPEKRLNDASNNSNFGTPYSGMAAAFNGTSSYLAVGDTGKSIKTIHLWLKAATADESIMQLSSGVSIAVASGMITAIGIASPAYYVDGVDERTISIDTWHHVVITTDTAIDVDDLTIGQVGANYFEGSICGVKLFTLPMTAVQVDSAYKNPERFSPLLIPAGPALYYPLIEQNADFLALELVSGKNGELNNITYARSQSGVLPQLGLSDFNKLGLFNGTSYLSVADDDALDITGNLTLYARILTTNPNQSGAIVVKNNLGSAYSLYLEGGNLNFRGGSTALVSTTIAANETTRLVATLSGTTGTIYKNGNTAASGTIAVPGATTGTLNIGSEGDATTNAFDGLIFEVAIWSAVLSGSNIALLEAGTSPDQLQAADLVAYYYNQGPSNWVDQSTNGLAATLSGSMDSIYLPQGRISGKDSYGIPLNNLFPAVFKLDGAEYIAIADTADLDLSALFTIGLWVFPKVDSGTQQLIYKAGAYRISLVSGSGLVIGVSQSSSETTLTYSTGLTLDQWAHVFVTYDGSEVKLFIDAQEAQKINFSGALDNASSDLYAGANDTPGEYFTGYLDEIKIYCKVLSDNEIYQDYVDSEPDHRNSNNPTGQIVIGDPNANTIIGDNEGNIIGSE